MKPHLQLKYLVLQFLYLHKLQNKTVFHTRYKTNVYTLSITILHSNVTWFHYIVVSDLQMYIPIKSNNFFWIPTQIESHCLYKKNGALRALCTTAWGNSSFGDYNNTKSNKYSLYLFYNAQSWLQTAKLFIHIVLLKVRNQNYVRVILKYQCKYLFIAV